MSAIKGSGREAPCPGAVRAAFSLALLASLAGCFGHSSTPAILPPDAFASEVDLDPPTPVVANGVAQATVNVTVRDASGRPLVGQVVLIAATGSANTLTQPPGPTNAAGLASGAIASTLSETKLVTVTVNPGPGQVVLAQTALVPFVGDPSTISATISSATASPVSGVVADGAAPSAITVTVRDAFGNAVAGQSVQLAATGTGNTLTQPPSLTDASGVAAGALSSTLAETKTITARVNPGPGEVVLVQQPTVDFVGDPSTISAAGSTAVGSPATNVVANGSELSTLTVTLRDANGNPVGGQTVQLAATGTGNTLTQPPTVTDAAGVATGTLATTMAESKTITATANPGLGQVVLAQQPTVDYVGDPSTISAAGSTAVASPATNVVADGADLSTVTVTVRDANGNPVAGQTVQLATTGTGNALTQPPSVTDAAGVATGAIATTVAETKTITATVNPGLGQVVLVQQPTVGFVASAGSISPTLSTAVASPALGVVANGADLSTVTVTVRDANGNPVAGQTVQLATTGTGNALTQPPSVTDAAGIATGTLASTVAETKTITATVNPGPGQVVLAQQPTVDYVGDPSTISAAGSTAVASPATNVVANGADLSTVTVTVRDANGNPVAGQTVQLATTGTGNALTQPPSVTDAAGVATGTLASTVAETKTITATVNPGPGQVVLAQQPTVDYYSPTISPTLSTVVASPTGILVANGVELATITLTVRDTTGNPMAGRTVQLSATGSANALAQPPSVTDAGGVAIGALATTAAESKTVTAVVDPGPGQVVLAQQPALAFVWSPANAYYVRRTGSDPVGCTGGTTPATAWRTIGKAASCAPPGATVYVGAGTYLESVQITSGGTIGNPIRYLADVEGAFAGDAGDVIVDGGGASQTVHVDGASYVCIEGFTVTGAGGLAPCGGIRLGGGACTGVVLRGNRVFGSSVGIYVENADGTVLEHNQVSNHSGAIGDGIVVRASDGVVVRNNLVYNNAGRGIAVEGASLGLLVEANTLYMNAGDQVSVDGSGATATVRNNVIAYGLQAGIRLASGSALASTFNDVWANAVGNWVGLPPSVGDQSQDPLLIDPDGTDGFLGGAQGADDRFFLDASAPSPALDAGLGTAASIATSDGLTLGDCTSRADDVLDGSAPDGVTVNLGFHYEAAIVPLGALDPADARLAYGRGADRQVRVRTFDDSAGAWGADAPAPSTASVVKWVVAKVSPLDSGEELFATLSDSGAGTQLDLLRWQGASWSRELRSTAIAIANSGKRGFDVEYESLSGDVLVVYSNNTLVPVYRVRTAGTWTAETPLPINDGAGPNPDPTTGVVHWIELEPRPDSDEIALGFSDANRDFAVVVWDGSQWLTASAVRLDNNLKAYAATGVVHHRAFDLAYEPGSGDLMAAWARSNVGGFRYAVKPAGSPTFGGNTNVGGAPSAAPHFVDLASDPGSDRIAYAGLRLEGSAPAERLGLATWNGSAWVNIGQYDSQAADLANTAQGDFPLAVGWVGTTGIAACVYPDDNTGAVDWARWTAATGWGLQGDVAVAAKGFTDSVQILCDGASIRLLALFSDSFGNLFAGSFDGATWTVGGSALEPSLSSVASTPFGGSVKRP